MLTSSKKEGFSLIELMITIGVLSLMLLIALPSMTDWLQTAQIRTAAETALSGIQQARSEAISRNSLVRFQFVTNLSSTCALDSAGPDWVVSMDDANGLCDVAFSDTTSPRIRQTKLGAEGAPNSTVSATGAGLPASVIVFNGIGRVSGAGNIDVIDIANPTGGACQHAASAGPMRCLRIQIAPGGDVRLCDPKVNDATDIRIC